jgi:predicted nucleotidyltransferase component of viral defense system
LSVSLSLPPLPGRALLADLCREAAARERVEPQLIEKDFYLTRLLWALGQRVGDALLLKGRTLLSKVDLGFFRMSEDADLVLPGTPSRRSAQNVERMHGVRDARPVRPSLAPHLGAERRMRLHAASTESADGRGRLRTGAEKQGR